jgi:hypothetical protein
LPDRFAQTDFLQQIQGGHSLRFLIQQLLGTMDGRIDQVVALRDGRNVFGTYGIAGRPDVGA